jgi:hypothetical protein
MDRQMLHLPDCSMIPWVPVAIQDVADWRIHARVRCRALPTTLWLFCPPFFYSAQTCSLCALHRYGTNAVGNHPKLHVLPLGGGWTRFRETTWKDSGIGVGFDAKIYKVSQSVSRQSVSQSSAWAWRPRSTRCDERCARFCISGHAAWGLPRDLRKLFPGHCLGFRV